MSGHSTQPNQSLAGVHTSQARHLYSESKTRICERIAANIQSTGSVIRQIVKGSKSSDILWHTSRSLCSQENTIENTTINVKKLEISSKQFQMQLEDINKSCEKIRELVETIN